MVKLTSKQAKGIVFDDCLDEDFSIEEEGIWKQEGKQQYSTTIFKYKERYYSLTVGRSGSPYTDWDYDWEWYDSFDCPEVEKVEVVNIAWREC